MLVGCQKSLGIVEREREQAGREADRARAELKQAKALILKKDRALQTTTQEQSSLKAELVAKVAKAEMDVVKAYKNGFKDIINYLFLMRDAMNEYKASIKRVDPTFDGDYYDRLISSEPTTLAPEDSDDDRQEEAEPGQENAPAEQPPEAPTEWPSEAPAAAPPS